MKVCVIGTGYVGLVTGTCLADMGHDVVCQDIDATKIAKLERGELPIYEPGLTELVHANTRQNRLVFTTDLTRGLQDAELCFIAVGTPPGEDGSADLRYVLQAAEDIARRMHRDLLIAVKSTVPVGTCDEVHKRVGDALAARGVHVEYDVVSNPEFLKEGMAIDDFMRPDRIVIGARHTRAAELMRRLYKPFIKNGHPFLVMDVRSSELTKYAANAMLATRISLMNELANLCDQTGADIMQVRQGVGSDKRIGMSFLYAGAGYGGSCFPKDVLALAQLAHQHGLRADMLEAVERVNHAQKSLLAERIFKHFEGRLDGKRIAVWGIAFKPKTDDIREAPAVTLIEKLTAAGANVIAHDPEAMPNARTRFANNTRLHFVDEPYAALEDADALALVTEWGLYRDPDFERMRALMRGNAIFDGRNQYEPAEVRRLGFSYQGIGRGRA